MTRAERLAYCREIYAFYLQEAAFERRRGVKAVHYQKNFPLRLWATIRSLAGNLLHWRRLRGTFDDTLVGKRWVVAGSRNEEDSTAFLLADDRYTLIGANVYEGRARTHRLNWFPRPKLAYLPAYLPVLWTLAWEQPRLFRYVFQVLIHGIGALENSRVVLRRYRPEVVVVSNDHLPALRALVVAARLEGIPTVYLPHAPVADDFPPLIVDLALLEGPDTLEKYRAGGKPIRGAVELIGSPKYDAFRDRVNRGTTIRRVGIPYGFFEETDLVVATARRLLERFPDLTVTLRPHPRDLRPRPEAEGVRWSDSKEESALDYLTRQDLIAATDTGIHLEAVLLNVTSCYAPFLAQAGALADAYGFVRHGLVTVTPETNDLVALIVEQWDARRPVAERAWYFVSTPAATTASSLAGAAIDRIPGSFVGLQSDGHHQAAGG